MRIELSRPLSMFVGTTSKYVVKEICLCMYVCGIFKRLGPCPGVTFLFNFNHYLCFLFTFMYIYPVHTLRTKYEYCCLYMMEIRFISLQSFPVYTNNKYPKWIWLNCRRKKDEEKFIQSNEQEEIQTNSFPSKMVSVLHSKTNSKTSRVYMISHFI